MLRHLAPVRRSLAGITVGCVLVACSASSAPQSSASSAPQSSASTVGPLGSAPPIRLIFLGDVMLGRGVGVVAAADPGSVFERLRPVLVDADLALANLESPLTTRPHTAPGFALEADPAVAPLLASGGLDVVALANNHATDGGPETVLDTMSAVAGAGVLTVGAGADHATAAAPLVVEVGELRVGTLAFDLAGGSAAGPATPGVNTWDPDAARQAVTALRTQVDLVIVSLHGGVEYLPRPDPVLERVTGQVGEWGADIVWGHGAHVPYPVTITDAARPAVVAPGLGNALFDQRLPGTDSGTVMEVLADATGVLAVRTGRVAIEAGRSSFVGWDLPEGDAVALRSEWWTPVQPVTEQASAGCSGLDREAIIGRLPEGSRPLAIDCGHVTGTGSGTGTIEMVVAYRRPATAEVLHQAFPDHEWADAEGYSAHLAVMEPDGRMAWGAATLLDPIGSVRVCSGSLAVGQTLLDDPTVISAGAWSWSTFGFRTARTLTGPTSIGCADVDHDGTTEPLVRRPAES